MCLVSVIIPTYNSAHLISDAIDSVLSQTYSEYEIIVVDDGSSDATHRILQQYGDMIQYVAQPNQGSSVARQTGISLATGNYIAALDADDWWLPNKLADQVTLLESVPEAGICYSDGYVSRNGQLDINQMSRLSHLYSKGKNGNQFPYFFKVGAIPTSSMLFRKEVFKTVGGYNPELRWGDFELVARVLAHYPAVHIDVPLMVYRFHDANSSSRLTSKNVSQQIDFKRQARMTALKSIPDEQLDRSIRIFKQAPRWVQIGILVYWRVQYGNSILNTLQGTLHYSTQLFRSVIRKPLAHFMRQT